MGSSGDKITPLNKLCHQFLISANNKSSYILKSAIERCNILIHWLKQTCLLKLFLLKWISCCYVCFEIYIEIYVWGFFKLVENSLMRGKKMKLKNSLNICDKIISHIYIFCRDDILSSITQIKPIYMNKIVNTYGVAQVILNGLVLFKQGFLNLDRRIVKL